uniref:Uncharacterized protein n=1 Tax=Lutzomyia longipalpis TaxID=7200 RepID=A0A1B0CA75_LUTLO
MLERSSLLRKLCTYEKNQNSCESFMQKVGAREKHARNINAIGKRDKPKSDIKNRKQRKKHREKRLWHFREKFH